MLARLSSETALAPSRTRNRGSSHCWPLSLFCPHRQLLNSDIGRAWLRGVEPRVDHPPLASVDLSLYASAEAALAKIRSMERKLADEQGNLASTGPKKLPSRA
jgi:hypothetical protein